MELKLSCREGGVNILEAPSRVVRSALHGAGMQLNSVVMRHQVSLLFRISKSFQPCLRILYPTLDPLAMPNPPFRLTSHISAPRAILRRGFSQHSPQTSPSNQEPPSPHKALPR